MSSKTGGVAKVGYKQVAEALIERIRSGEFASGDMLPTEEKLQREYGVSRTTVRRALAGVVETGFGLTVPNKGIMAEPPQPASNSTQTIGFIDADTPVLNSVYREMSRILLKHGYHLLHIDSQGHGLDFALEISLKQECAGVFVWSHDGFPDAEALEKVSKSIPLVLMDHQVRGFQSDIVAFDCFQMAFDATSHLIESGRKEIGIAGMMDMLDVNHDRLSGYMKAVFCHGQNPRPRNFLFTMTSGTEDQDCFLLSNRLHMDDRPDAIFVMQDICVPAVVQAVLAAELRIPEDIAIVTIGDDIKVTLGNLGITAIRYDWSDFAGHAIQLMLSRLNGVKGSPRRRIARHSLTPKGSCGEFCLDLSTDQNVHNYISVGLR